MELVVYERKYFLEAALIRVKFKTEDDRVSGYCELAATDIVRTLPGNTFEISESGKAILDKAGIRYEVTGPV